jgi:adenylate cyclase
MIADADSGFRIGGFAFDTETLQLQNSAGEPVYLRPQSAQVLSLLVQNAGEVVSKDDLIVTVWQNFSVTDDSLVQCIAEIRRALEDKDRHFVKTFPKRGYMLVTARAAAQARPLAVDPAWLDDLLETPRCPILAIRLAHGQTLPTDCSTRPGTVALVHDQDGAVFYLPSLQGALSLALDLAAQLGPGGCQIALDYAKSSDLRPGPDSTKHLLALLRLADHAAQGEVLAAESIKESAIDPLDCLFCDRGEIEIDGRPVRVYAVTPPSQRLLFGQTIAYESVLPTIAIIPPSAGPSVSGEAAGDIFADDLIMCLSRTQEINVISRLSTAAFRNRSTPLHSMRNALRADFVLSGSIRIKDDSAILNLELTETDSHTVLWADRLETPVTAIVQEPDLVHRVSGLIRKALMMRGIAEVQKQSLNDVKAHHLLLASIQLMHRLTLRDFTTAGTLLSALIERCPHHAAPLAWQARWHVLRLQQGWTENIAGAAQAALDSARRALDLNPENTLALTSEGHVLTNLWRRLDEAEACYDAALEINPNDANGRILRGMLYSYQGKGALAKEDTERALHLAPLDPNRFFFLALAAGANIAAGDYQRALELSDHSLRLNRSHTSTIRGKIVAQIGLKQIPAARATAKHLLDLQPKFRVSEWLKSSPAADFAIGKHIAVSLLEAGIPN